MSVNKPTMKSDELAQWLLTVQGYQTSPEGLHRIAGSIAGLNQAMTKKSLSAQPLFWTEPSNLDTVLALTSSKGKHQGPRDE